MPNPTPPPDDAPPPAEVANDPLEGLVPGRIVYYYPLPYEARYVEGPWPAMVTKVGPGGLCTLNINMPAPAMVGTDPVARKEAVLFSASDPPTPGCWAWMFSGQNARYAPDRTA